MHDPRRAAAALFTATMLLLVGCGGSAAGPATPSTPGAAATRASDAASPDEPDPTATADDGTPSSDGGGGGTSPGDRTKGSAQFQVTGGLTETLDLPFAAVLSLWASSGPGSAYLPFTDGDAVLFMTINGDQVLVQYARSSTSVGLTSGGSPCILHTDVLDGASAKGTFSCPSMTLIQGESVGSASVSGTFDAHK